MRWSVIVVKKPVTTHTRIIPKILLKISQTVVFGIPRSFSSSRTVNRRSPSIRKLHTLDVFRCCCQRRSARTRVTVNRCATSSNRLYHSFICVMSKLSSTKGFCIISIVSGQLLPRLKQNLMQNLMQIR